MKRNYGVLIFFISLILSLNLGYVNANQIGNDSYQIYVNDQDRTIDEIASLSGLSVDDLKSLNQGYYDDILVVVKGDNIILPSDSLLIATQLSKNKNHIELPELGSNDSLAQDDDVIERYIAEAAQYLATEDWDNLTSEKIKNRLNDRAQNYSKTLARNQLNQKIIDPLKQAAQNLLGYFGTAQLQFDISDKAKINNVNFKLFSPWYDSESMITFSQLSYQTYDAGRKIGNVGIGQRWDVAGNNWLIGYNVFLDHDFTEKSNRVGLGLEAWSDYLKFNANYYNPLSDWREDIHDKNKEQRAARGFDVKFQQYLPSYPHLGASLMFEQYFGEQVALFGKEKLQKDPYALTVGVDYTPVPILTVKAEHKQGTDSSRQSKIELGLNYRIGVPIKDQLDPNLVNAARTLKGSRYDLVDRNNYIVLEYRDKKFSVDLATIGEATEGYAKNLTMNVSNSKVKEYDVSWNNISYPFVQSELIINETLKELYARNGCIVYISETCENLANAANTKMKFASNNWNVVVPDYVDSQGSVKDKYTFFVTLKTSNNDVATSNSSTLTVTPSATRRSVEIKFAPNSIGDSVNTSARANGEEEIKLVARLKETKKNTYFNDNKFYENYPSNLDSATIDVVNRFWKIKENEENIPIVKEVSGCSDNQKCIILKEIKKSKVEEPAESGNFVDVYEISVTTKSEVQQLSVSTNFEPYTTTNSLNIYFSTSNVLNLAKFVVKRDDVEIGTGNLRTNEAKQIELGDNILRIGDTLTVEALNDNGSLVRGAKFVWSLVGDNSAAGCSNITTLPSGDDGPWYNVSIENTYTLKDSVTSDVANGRAGLKINDEPWGTSVEPDVPACAGDQGFRLRVTAYN